MNTDELYARWLALPPNRRGHFVLHSLREDMAMALLRRISDEYNRRLAREVHKQRNGGVVDVRPM